MTATHRVWDSEDSRSPANVGSIRWCVWQSYGNRTQTYLRALSAFSFRQSVNAKEVTSAGLSQGEERLVLIALRLASSDSACDLVTTDSLSLWDNTGQVSFKLILLSLRTSLATG